METYTLRNWFLFIIYLKVLRCDFCVHFDTYTYICYFKPVLPIRYPHSCINIAFEKVSYTNINYQIVNFIFSISQLSYL